MMAKRKAAKGKARKGKRRRIVPTEPLDPYEEYGNSSPGDLSLMILSEFDDNNSPVMDWVDAIYACDKTDGADKHRLVELLKSTGEKRDLLIADWIERYDHVKKTGRPRLPIYNMTEGDKALHNVSYLVKELRTKGFSRTDAFARVVADVDNAAVDSLVHVDGWSLRDAVKRVFTEPESITEDKLADFDFRRRRSTRKKK
jgi:hypothetical protein